jgi:SAM-dependent methyltransferase
VVGADMSLAQLRASRAAGLVVFVARGEALALLRRFDAVFSNAALHWMKASRRSARLRARRAAPGGTLRRGAGRPRQRRERARGAACGARAPRHRSGGLRSVVLPVRRRVRARLRAHSFEIEELRAFSRPTPLPGELREWLLTFAQPFLAALPLGEREPLLVELRERLRERLQRADGTWVLDYVRLRFRARRA